MLRELPSDFLACVDSEPNSVLLRTARFDSLNSKSYLFRKCREVVAAHSLDDLPAVFAEIEAALHDGNYVAGFLSYECGGHFEPKAIRVAARSPEDLPLAWFGVYRSPVIFDHSEASLKSQNPPLRSHTARTTSPPIQLDISAHDFAERMERIKRYIEAGDTYQVNFTTELRMPCNEAASTLFSSLLESQPVAYGALLNMGPAQVISASPELFFRLQNDKITTRPMKGTARRGKDIKEDTAIAAWLAQDEKNRSENVMIVDLLRNDLGRICEAGSVQVEQLFAVEKYRTLFQMTSTVSGRPRANVSFYEIFQALFPSGSIVGAPKVRTMQIISELEQRRRGVYAGAIGFISLDREAVFSVAIRTLVLRNEVATMGVGSGIVYDSDAGQEYSECLLKAEFLTQATPNFELIETMLWEGSYFLLEEHLERLAASAEYFEYIFDREEILAKLREAEHGFTAGLPYRVRLLLGNLSQTSLTSSLIQPNAEPASIMVASEKVHSQDLFLRHKTTHRAVYDRVYQEAVGLGFRDALFLNERHEVAECSIHSLIVEKDGKWLTPPLSAGALPGVYRRHLLETRSEVREETLTLDSLRAADRIYICNSVRGLCEVGSIRCSDKVLFSSITVRADTPAYLRKQS